MSQCLDYAVAVMAAPYAHQANHSALAFARALVTEGHRLRAVFFYQDGVTSANGLMAPPQNEQRIVEEWQVIAKENACSLLVCVAAGLRRGILDEREAQRHGLPASSLAEGFELAGIGQLVHMSASVDRLITFV